MNRDQMLDALRAGEDPLEVTIRKYKELPSLLDDDGGLPEDHDPFGWNCALCEKHRKKREDCDPHYRGWGDSRCGDCPLNTDEFTCDNAESPWEILKDTKTKEDYIAACENMVEVLESLRKE